MTTLADNTHIYCDNCESIQPMLLDEMPGTDTSGKFIQPTDVLCGTCKLVIATTYSEQPKP